MFCQYIEKGDDLDAIFEILIGVFLLRAFVHFWFTKRKNEHDLSLLVTQLNTSEEF